MNYTLSIPYTLQIGPKFKSNSIVSLIYSFIITTQYFQFYLCSVRVSLGKIYCTLGRAVRTDSTLQQCCTAIKREKILFLMPLCACRLFPKDSYVYYNLKCCCGRRTLFGVKRYAHGSFLPLLSIPPVKLLLI